MFILNHFSISNYYHFVTNKLSFFPVISQLCFVHSRYLQILVVV